MARIRRQLLGCALLLVGAAGFAASSKAKAKRKSKPGGFGASAKPPKAVDALSLLRTSEELYDSLEEKYELSDEAVRCRSFIVAARADGARLASSSVTSLGALSDWVPIASLLLVDSAGRRGTWNVRLPCGPRSPATSPPRLSVRCRPSG